jgi:predicted RNA binding protein YcfA (HicA-like mRNA interferase family)
VARIRHSKKEVEAALQYAEQHGWTVFPTKGGHRWGKAQCGQGCTVSIWSTPRNPGNHAKQIQRAVDKCSH